MSSFFMLLLALNADAQTQSSLKHTADSLIKEIGKLDAVINKLQQKTPGSVNFIREEPKVLTKEDIADLKKEIAFKENWIVELEKKKLNVK